jgi:hypothetical protein
MTNMTDQGRVNSILNNILNGGSFSAWPTALRLRLMTAVGSNTSNGTEATAGNCPGYTAPSTVAITFGAASAGVSTSTDSPSWTATGSWATITACEIWDIAGTPLRWLQGLLTASITGVSNGDTVQFATGAVTASGAAW